MRRSERVFLLVLCTSIGCSGSGPTEAPRPTTAASFEPDPEIEAKAAAAAEDRRLAGLWAYQTGTESGGAQSAASIFASQSGSNGERIRLILRRHATWGVSAYLYAGGGGFSCPEPCAVSLRFDGGPDEPWPASRPATGEPAIFIEDHEGLAERIAAADHLEIDVVLVDHGPTTIVFEVGGFDPAKCSP